MKNVLKLVLATAVVLSLTAPLAMAQVAPAPSPGAPSAGSAPPPSAMPSTSPNANVPREQTISGPVKGVDPMAKTVKVGRLMGLFSKTLQVDDNTQIDVHGSKASLTDIREGDQVKASYESRNGEDIAKSIDVTSSK